MSFRLITHFRILLVIVLFTTSIGCKKNDSDPAPTNPGSGTPTPVVTPRGVVLGQGTSATIGATGGTIQSADGLLTLTIPAGALTSNVAISIQPISNEAPLGFGNGYRLEPEGTTFAVPITMTFAYTDIQLESTNEDFLWVVTQASNGSWSAVQHRTLNKTANTVTVQASHFSDWTLGKFIDLSLSPTNVNLMVGHTISLAVTGFEKSASVTDDDELVPLFPIKSNGTDDLTPLAPIDPVESQYQFFATTIWTLNGTDAPITNSDGHLTGNNGTASYTAPAQVPANNPVAITAELWVRDHANQSYSFYVTSNITIIETDLYLSVNIDGQVYTYYQYGLNGSGLPPDPDHYFLGNAGLETDNTLGLVGVESTNGNYTNTFSIYLKNPVKGTKALVGSNASGDDDASWYPGSNTLGYTLNYVERHFDGQICDQQYRSANMRVTLTTYQGQNLITEGTFSGILFEDNIALENNCLMPIEHQASGEFRLKVL